MLKRSHQDVLRENDKLTVDSGYLKDTENKLDNEIKQMNHSIREKKDNLKENVNEVIEHGIKDERIIDETRVNNDVKIRDLEERLRQSIMKKVGIKLKMENMIQSVHLNVSNEVYNTFVKTDFLDGGIKDPRHMH